MVQEVSPVIESIRGYGHFDFAPDPHSGFSVKCIEEEPSEPPSIASPWMYGEYVSEDYSPRELPPFPFMRLPIELRFRVFELYLAPFTEDRSSQRFLQDFPGLRMEGGLRFNVFDGEYDRRQAGRERDLCGHVSVLTPARDLTQESQQPASIIDTYHAIQTGTIDQADIPSGYNFERRPNGTCQSCKGPMLETDTSEFSAGDTDNSEDSEYALEEGSDAEERVAGSLKSLQLHGEDGDEDEDEDDQNSVSLWQHPHYDVEMDPTYLRGVEQCLCHYHQRKYQTLRCLSQVSRRFTHELGQCLWKNAIVHFSNPELFFPFFSDRPLVCTHVRCLSIDVMYEQRYDIITPSCLLLQISDFASHNLRIWRLAIRLFTDLSLPSDLPKLEALHLWATAFRSLRTEGRFSLHLLPPDENAPRREENTCPALYDMWLPNTLRNPAMFPYTRRDGPSPTEYSLGD